jgi:hypothetical protein
MFRVVPASTVVVPSVVVESVVVTPVQAGSSEQVGANSPFKKKLA